MKTQRKDITHFIISSDSVIKEDMVKSKTRIMLLLRMILVIFIMLPSCKEEIGQYRFTISIFQVVEYELIANMRDAFVDEINSSELAKKNKVNILPYKDAHNDVNLTNQIADQIIADKPDLIYVLGTPVAQALVQRTS